MPRGILLTVTGALAIAVACSSFRPRVGSTTNRPGIFDGRAREPGSTGEIGGRGLPSARPGPPTRSPVAGADARQICRTSTRPAGWIAVAYVAGDASCAARSSADSAHAVAVLARYDDLPTGAVLDVCADERIPTNWAPDPTPAVPSEACPGASGDPTSTTRSITRLR